MQAYLDIRKTGETVECQECEENRRDHSLLINGNQIGEKWSEQDCNKNDCVVAEKIQEKTAMLVQGNEETRKQRTQNEFRNQTEILRNQNERKDIKEISNTRTSGGQTKKCNKPKKKEEKKKIVNTQNIQTPKITETSISSSRVHTEFESPPLLSTMQEVKDYMDYNGDVKFLVSDELSNSEEFCNFKKTSNKKNVSEASLFENDCDTKEDATSTAGARAKMCWSCHDTIGGPTGLSKCRGCRR